MEYPICTQSVKEKNFGIACLGKQFVFQSDISAYSLIIRLFYFQKYRNFIGSRSCPNQTIRYGVSSVYLERKTKRIFVIACLQKTSYFNRKYRPIRFYTLILFSKIQNFYRVKELSKSNQTRYGVSHVHLERKTKNIFDIQKRSFFNRKFRLIRLFYFQK